MTRDLLVVLLMFCSVDSRASTFCSDVALISEDIMETRQAGFDLETNLVMLEATIVESEKDREIYFEVSEVAWTRPVHQNEDAIQKEIKLFGDMVYAYCLRNWE